jgi:hypothetical protein
VSSHPYKRNSYKGRSLGKTLKRNADLVEVIKYEEASIDNINNRFGLKQKTVWENKKCDSKETTKSLAFCQRSIDKVKSSKIIFPANKKEKVLKRPNTSLDNYESNEWVDRRFHKREKSHNFNSGTSRNHLQSIQELRDKKAARGCSLAQSFNSTSFQALDALKIKNYETKFGFLQGIASVRSSAANIINYNEARNISKLNKQREELNETCEVNIEPVDSSGCQTPDIFSTIQYRGNNVLQNSTIEWMPLVQRDTNTPSKNENTKKCCFERLTEVDDKYQSLGLACNLIVEILNSVQTDPMLQLDALDEWKRMIETKNSVKYNQSSKAKNFCNLKLRQAIRRQLNKENDSIEFRVVLLNIQDLLGHGSYYKR